VLAFFSLRLTTCKAPLHYHYSQIYLVLPLNNRIESPKRSAKPGSALMKSIRMALSVVGTYLQPIRKAFAVRDKDVGGDGNRRTVARPDTASSSHHRRHRRSDDKDKRQAKGRPILTPAAFSIYQV
jgi:hypothetical protein